MSDAQAGRTPLRMATVGQSCFRTRASCGACCLSFLLSVSHFLSADHFQRTKQPDEQSCRRRRRLVVTAVLFLRRLLLQQESLTPWRNQDPPMVGNSHPVSILSNRTSGFHLSSASDRHSVSSATLHCNTSIHVRFNRCLVICAEHLCRSNVTQALQRILHCNKPPASSPSRP